MEVCLQESKTKSKLDDWRKVLTEQKGEVGGFGIFIYLNHPIMLERQKAWEEEL